MRRRLSFVAVPLALLLVAACGGNDESSGTATPSVAVPATTDPVATADPASDTTATASSTTEPAATAAPTSTEPTAAVPDPAEGCPQGSWIGTAAELQKFYDEIAAASGGTITVQGQVLLELTPDGTVRWTPQDWGIATDFGGAVSEASLTGTISGTYSTDGGSLTTSNVDNQLAVAVTVNGVAIDATSALAEAFAEFPINESTFACGADGLVIGLRNISGGFTDVVFVPA
jgi:hypothetical protein